MSTSDDKYGEARDLAPLLDMEGINHEDPGLRPLQSRWNPASVADNPWAGLQTLYGLVGQMLGASLTNGRQLAYVAYVIPNTGEYVANTEEDILDNSDNVSRKRPKYKIYCYVVGVHDSILPTKLHHPNSPEGRMMIESLPYYETNDAPPLNERVYIDWNPNTAKKKCHFLERYDNQTNFEANKYQKLVDLPGAVDDISGVPTTDNLAFGQQDQPPGGTVAGQQLLNKQPSNWLMRCNNELASYITKTMFAPPRISTDGKNKVFYTERDFSSQKAIELEASNENLFAIIYHSGAPSIEAHMKYCVERNPPTISHYYIDNKNLIHELVETKFKSNHSDYGGCEGNNDLGIAINYSSFSTNYADMFLSPSTLKPAFKTLFDNGYLPIGPQAPFGMPSSVRQIYNKNHNMQIIPSAKSFENGWQLSNCIADHHNIQTNSLPIMEMVKREYNLARTVGYTNYVTTNDTELPYCYSPIDLKYILTSWKSNTLCGFQGMKKSNGIIASTWASASERWGGTVQEFYAYCRISGLNPKESFHATLGSLLCPGVVRRGDSIAARIINYSSYRSTFGDMFMNLALVPSPTSTKGKEFLIDAGRRLFIIADYYRDAMIRIHEASNDSSENSDSLGLFAATLMEDKSPWDNILEQTPSLANSTDCLDAYEVLRMKTFKAHQTLNKNISDSELENYESSAGKFIIKTSLQLFYYYIKKPGTFKFSSCVEDDNFFNNFKEKYKMDAKKELNL